MRATTKLFTILAMAAALAPMTPASAAGADAAIENFSFSPNPLNITAGDTVKWTNSDNATHTVTADNGSFGCHGARQSSAAHPPRTCCLSGGAAHRWIP